jgi:hypothetical protein
LLALLTSDRAAADAFTHLSAALSHCRTVACLASGPAPHESAMASHFGHNLFVALIELQRPAADALIDAAHPAGGGGGGAMLRFGAACLRAAPDKCAAFWASETVVSFLHDAGEL